MIILVKSNELCVPLHHVVQLVIVGRTTMYGPQSGYIMIEVMQMDQIPKILAILIFKIGVISILPSMCLSPSFTFELTSLRFDATVEVQPSGRGDFFLVA